MILRDKITTSDRLVKLIDFEKEQINEKRKKIKSLIRIQRKEFKDTS